MVVRPAFAAICLIASSAAISADMLPLYRGIYVSAGVPCKGASNADIISYWGADNGLNIAKVACRIDRMSRSGPAFAMWRTCHEIVKGGSFRDRINITIFDRASFSIRGQASFATEPRLLHYCGPKVER
jgi:hypothetical protein